MTHRLIWAVVLLVGGLGLSAARADADKEQQQADEVLLEKLGFKSDGPALVEFFKKRTLSKEEVQKLADTVKLLGDDSFQVREKATEDLRAAGRAAAPCLKEA